jgi:hypothetical protein
MTKQKHTPAPWCIEPHDYDNGDTIIITAPGIGILCTITAPTDGEPTAYSKETDEANARLIAAAPKLLAALIDRNGDLPAVQNGECRVCGREYFDDAFHKMVCVPPTTARTR